MTTLKIILASTRPGSIGPALGTWVAQTARRTDTFDRVEVLDLAEIDLPFLDEPHHPRLGRYTRPHTFAWSDAISTADALVIVTPEYNSGFPAPLKNALDFLHAEWKNKALGVVSYGGGAGGGAGAARMLRPVTDALGMVTAPSTVAVARAAGQVVDGEFVGSIADDVALADMLAEIGDIDASLVATRSTLAMTA